MNLFECAECKKTWQTIAKSDVLKHVKAIHNGDEQMIVDNRKRLQQQLRSFTAKCFPPEVVKRLKRGGGYCDYRFFHNLNFRRIPVHWRHECSGTFARKLLHGRRTRRCESDSKFVPETGSHAEWSGSWCNHLEYLLILGRILEIQDIIVDGSDVGEDLEEIEVTDDDINISEKI